MDVDYDTESWYFYNCLCFVTTELYYHLLDFKKFDISSDKPKCLISLCYWKWQIIHASTPWFGSAPKCNGFSLDPCYTLPTSFMKQASGFSVILLMNRQTNQYKNITSLAKVITNREVLSYGLHLFTGIDVVLVGLPVGFHSLQRFSQDLDKKQLKNRFKSYHLLSLITFSSLVLCNLHSIKYAGNLV